jgi:hypothetical protein
MAVSLELRQLISGFRLALDYRKPGIRLAATGGDDRFSAGLAGKFRRIGSGPHRAGAYTPWRLP